MTTTGSTTNRRTTKTALLALVALVLGIVAAGAFTSPAAALINGYSSSPSIVSDKADYMPGETVTLTGYNWAPGESVHIFVNDDVGQTWSRNVDVVAGDDGIVHDQFQLPTTFVADYSVTATGATSGTARTSFTDGNVKFDVAPTGATAQFVETLYAASTTCGGAVKSGFPKTLNGSNGDTVGVGNTESIRIDAAATSDQGGSFSAWSSTDSPASPFTVITGTGGKSICVPGFQNGNRNYRATYNAPAPQNQAPAIASNNATVTVNEGVTAANAGTWSDANAGDTVTLSASVGSVVKSGTNAAGTWSWSLATTDGPTQSQTVTITANDGNGGVTSTNFSLVVNNVTPAVTAPANQNATEDASSSFNLGSFTDPGADSPWAVTVNWGDGSTNTTFNQTSTGTITAQSHTFANPGTFTVTVSVKDKDNATGSASFSVTVAANNHAPTANAGGPYSGNEGSAIQLDGSGSSDPDAGDTITYAWSAGAAPCSFSSATAQKPTITCTDNGSFTVSLTVTDNHGAASSASNAALNVANVAPSSTFSAGGPVNEGQSFQLSLTGTTDPSSADTAAGFQYAFDCGDGSGYGAFGASNTRTCATSDDGVRSVKGKVKDKDGGVSEYTGSVTVNNVAPTIVSVSNDGPIDEGGSATITVTATDPAGAADPLSYEFDCGGDGVYEVGPQSGSSHACAFASSGSKQVNVRVSDGDGGSATGSTTVTVKNVAPTISSVTNDGPIDEGGSATVTVSASDPSDPLSYEFDCNGDSTFEVGPQAGSSHACSFDDDGAKQVNVRVSDGDGGSATGSTTVTVRNVAPTATFSNDGPVDEGSSFHLSLSGPSDPSSADTAAGFQYAFDCGSGSGYGAFGASNTGTCSAGDDGTRSVKGKIKDKDGGVSEYTGSVVVKNVAPNVTAAADQSADEGESKSFDLGSFSDPGADSPWKVHVDWGDGSSSDPADKASAGSLGNASHAYGDDGEYTVTVKVTDKDGGSGQATFKVTVANVPPNASLSNDGPVDEGSPATISFSGQSDPSSADTAAGFHYAYDCANGSLAGVTYATAGTSASAQCTYADNGTHTVRARIIDKDGGFNEYTTAVTVTNVPPSLTPPADDNGLEGSSKSFGLGSFSDPGANDNPWHLHVTWGDGSAAYDHDYSSQGALGMAPHSYADNGTYTVTETITDKDGGSDTQTFKVEIANADPTASLSNDGPVDEGTAATVSFADQSDPSSADTAAGFHYAYACDNSSLAGATYAGSGSAATKQCTFGDDGTYPVRARIVDKDGGFSEYTTNVVVQNVPPSVTAAADQDSDEGSSASFDLGSFSDPGADSPWKVHVDWGDGSSSDAADKTSTGSLGSASHSYDDNGSYTVTVKVTDKDGGVGQATFEVDVKNVAPAGSLGNDGPVDEGSPATISFSGESDPSNADTAAGFHYSYACDGNAASLASSYAGATDGASKQCTFGDNGSYPVKGRIFDKDGGSSSYDTTVQVRNVNPSLTPPSDDNGVEGSSKSFGLGSFSDPGANDDPWHLHVTWGDGSTAYDHDYNARGALGLAPHVYADNGTYTVTETLTDKDGGSDTQTFEVVVANADPVVTAAADQSADEGDSTSFGLGSFSDPGANDDPWKVHVDWGDGSSSDPADKNATGSLGNASHSYGDDGSYTVKVTVTDKDGGSGDASFAVAVKNVAPTASLGNDGPVDEGSPATVSFSGQSDPSSADTAAGFHYAFDCANGSLAGVTYATAGTSASAQCTYADNGTYTVRARIFDKDDGSSEYTTAVVVKNVPPSLSPPSDDTANEGESKSFGLGSFSDAGANDDPWHLHVTWGDGSAAYDHDYSSQGALGMAPHAYANNGTYTVTETITDKDGGTDTQTYKVEVKNVDPTVTAAADQASDEGSAKSFDLGSFDDPGANDDPWSVHVTWGDGSAATDLSKGSTGSLGNASHTYDDNGSYTVTVKVTDKDGGSDEATFKVDVANVDPTATLGNDGPVDEGSPATVSFSAQHDASSADTAAGFHYAYACDNGSLAGATYAGSGAAASHQCTFADDGTYPVRARILDKDGGFSEYTTNVVVKNVAPSVTAAADQASDEGSSASFGLGSFSDPGPDSPWKVHVDWGDGSSSDPADKGSTGSLGSASHTYDDNGSYTVKVTVSDKDGGSGSASFKVTVANVAPTGSLGNDGPVDEGSPATVSFSGQHDPSNADTSAGFHYSYACNGLASSLATTYAGATDGASKQCTFADNGSYPVKGRIFDKDGGSSTYDTTVQVQNVKPSLTPPSDDNGVEGTSKSFGLGSFSDPGANDNPWHLHVTWGDGSAAYDHDYAVRGALGMAPHAYDDNGVYTVTETITDKDGGSDTQTFKVTISNANPTASLGNNGPVSEGSSATVSFSGQHDPSSADTAAGFHYAYSCSNGDLSGSNYGNSGSSASTSCSFNDNGSFPVKARIIDKDNGFTEYTTSVTVTNVAPSATFSNDGPVNEGQSFHLTLSGASDPSSADTAAGFQYAFDCGGGSYGAFGSSNSATCSTSDNGVRSVKGKVKDKDGGVSEYTGSVTVGNVPPTITAFSGTSTGLSGPLVFVPSAFNGTFTDPGLIDNPWAIAWSWDGVADPAASQTVGANGTNTHTFSQSHTYTAAGCNHTATVKVTDKDGGFDTKTTTVGVGTGAFLPPMTNQPVTNKLKNGQVLPVKIQITDCAGAGVNSLSPTIRLVDGDQTSTFDDSAVSIAPDSVSSADTNGVMRSSGSDGSYIYNMRVNVAKMNADYTVVIYPYGNGQATGPTLRHVIQATK